MPSFRIQRKSRGGQVEAASPGVGNASPSKRHMVPFSVACTTKKKKTFPPLWYPPPPVSLSSRNLIALVVTSVTRATVHTFVKRHKHACQTFKGCWIGVGSRRRYAKDVHHAEVDIGFGEGTPWAEPWTTERENATSPQPQLPCWD